VLVRKFEGAETHFPAVPRCQAEVYEKARIYRQCKCEARWPEDLNNFSGPKVYCTRHAQVNKRKAEIYGKGR